MVLNSNDFKSSSNFRPYRYRVSRRAEKLNGSWQSRICTIVFIQLLEFFLFGQFEHLVDSFVPNRDVGEHGMEPIALLKSY